MINIALCALRDLMASRRARPALIPQRCLPATRATAARSAAKNTALRLLRDVHLGPDDVEAKHDVSEAKHDVVPRPHDVVEAKHDVVEAKHDVVEAKHDVIEAKHDVMLQSAKS